MILKKIKTNLPSNIVDRFTAVSKASFVDRSYLISDFIQKKLENKISDFELMEQINK
jgi:metal-responsive CopG/Arc/MetJ family transcriptional regulator